MLYPAGSKGPFKCGSHDPDTDRLFGITFRPNVWQHDTVYLKPDEDNYGICIATNFTGVYYKVKNPGKSGAIEPTWNTVIGGETADGTLGLTWETMAYSLLSVDETITAVDFTATNGVTLSTTAFTDTTCQWFIDAIPSDATARTLGVFEVHIHATKDNAETIDATLQFKLAER
jgi:hypothetical protein